MHRTTTTATLLVTVAVAALTGCVTVQRPPASAAAATTRPAAPHPEGSSRPADAQAPARDAQAPAREALAVTGPGDPAGSARPAARAPRPAGAAPAGERRRPGPVRTPGRHGRHPAPRHHRTPRSPRVEVPAGVMHVPPRTPDVCALGRQYGGWAPDSPESRICRQAYGR